VAADVGRVALQRGPLVYCVEDADLDIGASEVALLRTTPLSERWEAGFLGGVVVLQADGCAPAPVGAGHGLYADKPRSYSVPAQLKAVPYCTWDNRVPGAMAVWLPEVVS
jgi:DUF1680 family protein